MTPQADPQSGKCSYIDPLSFILSSKTGLSLPTHSLLPHVFDLNPSFSWKNTFSFGAIWDLFLEYTACCDGFDIILKYDPKNDLINKKCPNMSFSMRLVFEILSKNNRARTAATATEEFSQSIQVPSSTHPGTTYPVRAIPHSVIYIYIYIIWHLMGA